MALYTKAKRLSQARPFFEIAVPRLGMPVDQIVMIGGDIRSDIDGAQRCGIRGLLVKTGKFQPSVLELEIRPYEVLDSIAALPAWWDRELTAS